MTTSGSWLFEKRGFRNWLSELSPEPDCRKFLLVGLPGMGKTVLARMTARRLKAMGLEVQYHFFDRKDQLKRTKLFCFHSLAAQLALTNKAFRDEVFRLYDATSMPFDLESSGMDFQTFWERFFKGILFQIRSPKPIFWILDGIDESDTPFPLLQHIATIESRTPIRIFMTSRPMNRIPTWGQALSSTYTLRTADTTEDMHDYVTRVVRGAIPDDQSTQNYVRQQVLSRASGSFLWTRLALEIV
jgi:hypothetical protein